MARPPTLAFERGTLLLHPPPPGKAWFDSATWDDRVERFRLPALRYRLQRGLAHLLASAFSTLGGCNPRESAEQRRRVFALSAPQDRPPLSQALQIECGGVRTCNAR